jgi:hypothetical protein
LKITIIFARLIEYTLLKINKNSMKKIILALLVAATAVSTANAQEPHSVLLYGDATIGTVRNPNLSKNTVWDANIGIGYQFNMNWTVGASLMWGQNASKDSTGNKTTNNMYSVGPFARYSKYFGKSEIFFWYGQFDFDYQGGYTTNEGNPATNKYSGVYVGFFPAIGVNVHRGLALNFNVGGLNYASSKVQDATNATNNFNFTFGHQVNIGISKNFGCHHKMHHSGEPGDEMHSRKAGKMDDEDDAAPKPKKKNRSKDDDE